MDKQEFERRVVASTEKLHKVALAILTNETDCMDAVQEALVRAWMKLPSLKQPQFFETWLCRILINECKTMLRKGKRHAAAMPPESLPAPEPPDPALWQALQQLQIQYRLPLVLHHVEGYSIAECAQMLSLPQSTVKWRIHQGKKAFGKLLEEEGAIS